MIATPFYLNSYRDLTGGTFTSNNPVPSREQSIAAAIDARQVNCRVRVVKLKRPVKIGNKLCVESTNYDWPAL